MERTQANTHAAHSQAHAYSHTHANQAQATRIHTTQAEAGASILAALAHHGEPAHYQEPTPPPDKPRHFALSRTTDRVLRILLSGDLARVRAESVAETLGMSCTTLRRRLRADHTSYQFLLDRARQYRCEQVLRERWRPGKCLADELGYLEVNSFYRAFRRWTGLSYSEYKLQYCC